MVWLLSSLAGARAAPAHAPAALAALLAPSMLTAAGRPRAPAAVDPRVAAALECFIQHYDAILEGQVCRRAPPPPFVLIGHAVPFTPY